MTNDPTGRESSTNYGLGVKTNTFANLHLPLVVALASLAATLVLWHALRGQERTQTERVVKLATYSIRADMIADMNIRILGLVRIAKLWQIWEKPRENEFRLHTSLYISHEPGCVAIGWVNPNLDINWVVPVDGDAAVRRLSLSLEAEQRHLVDSAQRTHDAIVGHSVPSGQDERFLPVWVPVFDQNSFQGFIVGVFRVHTLLDDITSDHADLGYEVVVVEGNDPIYYLSRAIPKNKWAQEATVPLPGANWRLQIWPSTKALPDTYPLSQVVLLGGIVVALQLTLTVYLAQKARLWARHVEASNEELVKENTERRHAEESMHRLSARLLQLQDEERRHIARELHDSTAQTLYGLAIKLRLVAQSERPPDPKSDQLLAESRQLADQCLSEMRTMAYLLHPPSLDELGLLPACRSLVKGFTERSQILVDLKVPPDLDRLPREMETALFRVMQESLSNIHRHSGSKTACIQLSENDHEIRLEVSDQGRGLVREMVDRVIDETQLGVGIAGMRERIRQLGGQLEIRSSSKGTTVIAVLPRHHDGKPVLNRVYTGLAETSKELTDRA
jgi:signal transduction histidine kinase